ncbi:MAG TPA: hypothetical protein ENJ27_01525 [Candidatus Moranbacteria bacterium]|nr:hypothetical protein [Candidatus Moranbacteria bacterium]
MRLFVIIFFIFSLAGAIIFLATPTIREYNRSKTIDKEISKLQAEAEKINTNNNFLREKIEYLKSDDYKERVAKDRLNLRNIGEKVIIVQPGTDKNIDEENKKINQVKNNTLDQLSNIQKWYKYLFRK